MLSKLKSYGNDASEEQFFSATILHLSIFHTIFKSMKKLLFILFAFTSNTANAQLPKVELYDLIKKLMFDSTGYENIGDWAVGSPKKFPVKWNEDRIIMSDDTAINFYRMGAADISIKGKTYNMENKQAGKWQVMLKGPRMGYSSFSIVCMPMKELLPKLTIDSIFGNKPYKAKLLKSCDSKTMAGYYYYEVKLPKKDLFFIKFSWVSVGDKAALRIDAYDNWSKYAVKLDCK